MKYRSIVVLFVLALAALFSMPAGVLEAAKPGLVVPVSGHTDDGDTLHGQLTVVRFKGRDGDTLVAKGLISGTLTNASGDSTAVKGAVQIEVVFLDTHELCNLMTMRLGSTDVRLKGQVVHLDTIVIQIAEDPGQGIDGNNLCIMAERFDDA